MSYAQREVRIDGMYPTEKQAFAAGYIRQVTQCALCLVVLATGAAFADDSKISPDLMPLLANPSGKVNVIVQYKTASQPQEQTCCSRILSPPTIPSSPPPVQTSPPAIPPPPVQTEPAGNPLQPTTGAPADNSQQPTSGANEQDGNSQQPGTGAPTDNSQQPTSGANEHGGNSQQPATGAPTDDSQQPTSGGNEQDGNSQQPATGADEPSESPQQPVVSAGTMQAADVITLSNQSSVTYISLDRKVTGTLDYAANAVNTPYAWNSGWDGTGVGIAVIDSGIYPHPDLNSGSGKTRVVYRKSFISDGVQYDDFGHGTHVAGIAAGNGSMSSKPGSLRVLRGIAPNANLLDLRVLDKDGASMDSVVIAAIQQAIQLKRKYNVRVINLSLGRPIYESCNLDPLCQAVEAAWRNGIVVVTAAGNLGRNGYATVLSPANSPHAITVGCMKTLETYPRSDDLIASYSSKGPTNIDLTVKPDLVAPGNLMVSLLAPGSTLAEKYPANVVAPSYYTSSANPGPTGYFRLSGTSMATPVVSGAVALMLQKDPGLSPDTVKARLMKTATKNFPAYSTATDSTTGQTYNSTYDIFTIGAGYLDIQSALSSMDVAYATAASPSVFYNPLTQQAYLVTDTSQTWGANVMWGKGNVWSTNVVWGSTTLVNGTNVVWGGNAVWGSSDVWGTNVVWGNNVVWGSTGVNGEK